MTARTDVGTVDELHASATKAVGLDDFGCDDDNYREALGVLLESYARDADFTELAARCPASSSATRWWPGCCPRPPGSSIPNMPR
jgi:hypothetical protein